jgi:hypothetical protein
MSTGLIRSLALLLTFAATLGVAACGKKDAAGAAPVKAPGAVRKVLKPADALSPYLVTAVPTGKGGTASVQLKFELGGRPEPGDPLDIDLVILPTIDNLDRVAGTVQGDDGLEIVDGATLAPADKPTAGTPIHRSVRVLPKREGIFVLSAVVSTDSGGQPANQTFLIPVIAGNGLAEAAAPPTPASGSKPTPTAAAQ